MAEPVVSEKSGAKKSPVRIPWLDVLRVVSCFMVILAHACDPYNFVGNSNEPAFWPSIYGSMVRPCVPLFVMIAGVLLIPVEMPTFEFLRRRFSRVLVPFLCWSLLYATVPALFGTNLSLEPAPYGTSEMWSALARIPLNFYGTVWHLWYMYMLFGLYLFLPVVSPWIRKASRRELEWFLGIWGVTLFLPYVKLFFPMIHGGAEWNTEEMLTPFTGYLGVMVLAHYLVKYCSDWKMSSRLLVGAPLFIVGFFITWIGFRHTFEHGNDPSGLFGGLLKEYGTEDALKIPRAFLIERFWWYLSINVMMMTTGMFIIFMGIRIRVGFLLNVVTELANKSFGVFLVHLFIIYNLYHALKHLEMPVWFGIPCNAVLTFGISYLIIKALSYLPKSRWLIG